MPPNARLRHTVGVQDAPIKEYLFREATNAKPCVDTLLCFMASVASAQTKITRTELKRGDLVVVEVPPGEALAKHIHPRGGNCLRAPMSYA